jgi:hypothetical protein
MVYGALWYMFYKCVPNIDILGHVIVGILGKIVCLLAYLDRKLYQPV